MSTNASDDQAVIIYMKRAGVGPSKGVNDLATLEDKLDNVIRENNLGEYDGNEIGANEIVLYMYSDNAERLYKGIETTLGAFPLCRGAKIVLRKGGPGAPHDEIQL